MAEQMSGALPQVAEWEPVLAQAFGGIDPEPDWTAIEQAVTAAELLPLRRPPAWPPDAGMAMLAATYAKRIGRIVAFSLAAFRQQFAAGRDLGHPDTVIIAAAACEMHPGALRKAVALRSVSDALARAQDRAQAAGVTSLPAIEAGGAVFTSLAQAARALTAER